MPETVKDENICLTTYICIGAGWHTPREKDGPTGRMPKWAAAARH